MTSYHDIIIYIYIYLQDDPMDIDQYSYLSYIFIYQKSISAKPLAFCETRVSRGSMVVGLQVLQGQGDHVAWLPHRGLPPEMVKKRTLGSWDFFGHVREFSLGSRFSVVWFREVFLQYLVDISRKVRDFFRGEASKSASKRHHSSVFWSILLGTKNMGTTKFDPWGNTHMPHVKAALQHATGAWVKTRPKFRYPFRNCLDHLIIVAIAWKDMPGPKPTIPNSDHRKAGFLCLFFEICWYRGRWKLGSKTSSWPGHPSETMTFSHGKS